MILRHTRNFDLLYIKYGLKMFAINKLIKKYSLDKEETILDLTESLNMKIKKR